MKILRLIATFFLISFSISVQAATDKYVIDVLHKHAYIQFKISHYGFSYVIGQFDKLKGAFCYDQKDPSKSHIEIEVDVSSLDTKHAERDSEARGSQYLGAEEYPKAKFISTKFEPINDETGRLTGDLTFHGNTGTISLDVTRIGMGKDPWGQFRVGFEGSFILPVSEFGLQYSLGEAANNVEVYVMLEGIRSKYTNIDC